MLDGVKTHVMDGASADELAVVARGAEGLGAFVVPAATSAAAERQVIDPTLPIATVSLEGVEVTGERVLVEPGDPAAETIIGRALEEATVAMALSTVATCRAIFEATLQYAKDREQFGKPIGSFQALKHRLADVLPRRRAGVRPRLLRGAHHRRGRPAAGRGRIDGQGGGRRVPASCSCGTGSSSTGASASRGRTTSTSC